MKPRLFAENAATQAALPGTAVDPQVVEPLARWYQSAGVPTPEINAIDPAHLPEPFRRLLVHERDMTSTLEDFHRDRIILRVLSMQHDGPRYRREVVLTLEHSGRPVEFGATHVRLATLPAEAQRLVLEAHVPFGAILRDLAIPYRSRPKAYFRVTADATMAAALHFTGQPTLYGRCNTLSAPDGTAIADIVEILPPVVPGI